MTPNLRRGLPHLILLLATTLIGGCERESQAEQAVRAKMLDPDATQFRNVGPCSADKAVTYGEANGKNLMGAYTGFKPFFYGDYHAVLVGDYDFTPMMERCFGKEAVASAD